MEGWREVPAPTRSFGLRWVRCRIRGVSTPREKSALADFTPKPVGDGGVSGGGVDYFSLVSCAKAKAKWGGTSLPQSEAAKPKPEMPPVIGGSRGGHSLILD